MPVWSDKAIDYSAGVILSPDGRIIPKKIGTWVMTTEESAAILKERQKEYEDEENGNV